MLTVAEWRSGHAPKARALLQLQLQLRTATATQLRLGQRGTAHGTHTLASRRLPECPRHLPSPTLMHTCACTSVCTSVRPCSRTSRTIHDTPTTPHYTLSARSSPSHGHTTPSSSLSRGEEGGRPLFGSLCLPCATLISCHG